MMYCSLVLCYYPLLALKLMVWSVQMSMRRDPSSVCIRDVLLEMRRYRMGLIQTADQLRFSYLAVIEGAKHINADKTLQASPSSQDYVTIYKFSVVLRESRR